MWKFLLLAPLIYVARFDRKTGKVLALVVALGVGLISLRVFALHHNYIREFIGTHKLVTVVGTIQSETVKNPPQIVGSHTLPARYSALLRSELAIVGDSRYKTRTQVSISTLKPIAAIPGDRISCFGLLLSSKNPKVSALLSVRGACKIIARSSEIWQIAHRIRTSFRQAAERIAGDGGSLIPGMVLGDTSAQSTQFAASMRRVGLTHLTAVSGENFAIVAGFVMWILQWVFKSFVVRTFSTSAFLLAFLFLVRPSPSVLRASVMTALLLFAKAFGKRSSPLAALGLAISTLILIDPFQALDPGFALSVLATAGILLLAPRLITLWKPVLGRLADFVAIPVSATLVCLPIILALSGQFSLVSIPANLLVAPVVAPITVLGFIGAILSPLFPAVTHMLLLAVSPLSNWIAHVAQTLSKIPTLSVTTNFLTIVLLCGLLTFTLIFLARKRWVPVIAFITLVGLTMWSPWSQWPLRDWVFANCNVGQGDASVINLGNQQAIVIDVGPDPALIDACLKRLKIRTISLLVLTHFHADHVGGLAGALNGRRVGSVWVSYLNQPILESKMVSRTLGRIPTHVVYSGQQVNLSQLSGEHRHGFIEVLWPSATNKSFAAMPGDGSMINNSSIAMLVDIDDVSIFEGADIEPPVQESIFLSEVVHPVQILKVSHHGSAYQYWPLLQRLHPKIAVISVGKGNSYGHPSSQTLAKLRGQHAQILRTDLDGAIAINNSLKIGSLKRDWWRISWG